MDKDLKKQIEIKGLVISRIPSWAKTEIKKMSKDLFADDYGMTLTYLLLCYSDYLKMKESYLSYFLKKGEINNGKK